MNERHEWPRSAPVTILLLNPPVSDLSVLIASAKPELIPGEFVFVCLTDSDQVAALNPLCVFQEAEGTTAICSLEMAESRGYPYSGVFRRITLTVHSSLEAVGFLAAVAGALAAEGIPCNAVSAYRHDHLFVPSRSAEKALEVLSRLSA